MNVKPVPIFADMPTSVQRIILDVIAAAPYGVGVRDILGRSSASNVVRLRWYCWWRQRNELTMGNGRAHSFPLIGRHWRRHHSTIIGGVGRYAADTREPPEGLTEMSVRKQTAYRLSRTAHAKRYRKFYPHLGLPHVRTPT